MNTCWGVFVFSILLTSTGFPNKVVFILPLFESTELLNDLFARERQPMSLSADQWFLCKAHNVNTYSNTGVCVFMYLSNLLIRYCLAWSKCWRHLLKVVHGETEPETMWLQSKMPNHTPCLHIEILLHCLFHITVLSHNLWIKPIIK